MPSQGDQVAIVISHDCDLAANPALEPTIEVIAGTFLPKEDGSFTHAKNTRKLHLPITESRADHQRFAEFRATGKFQIAKEQLADHVPSGNLFITANALGILRRWLAARYRRHAFPDAFEARFDKVEDKFRDALKPSSRHLRAILFDLDEEQQVDLTNPDDTYTLDIYLVYTSQPDFNRSLEVAEATKAKVEGAFQDKYKHAGPWKEIELRSCDVISDDALTYAQYLQLAEWRSEGLSLRTDPPGPMTEEKS